MVNNNVVSTNRDNSCKKLVIIGASGHGKVVADIANYYNYSSIYFLDDDSEKKENVEHRVIGKVSDFEKYIESHEFIVAIGNNETRNKILQNLIERNAKIATLIHPSAQIGSNVIIGQGSVVMANVVINADTVIGVGCIVNTSSSVDHDCKIKDYVHISPGAHVAGNVTIGEMSWLGICASVVNNISITNNVTIGAGGVVVGDINESGTYVGVPVEKIVK